MPEFCLSQLSPSCSFRKVSGHPLYLTVLGAYLSAYLTIYFSAFIFPFP